MKRKSFVFDSHSLSYLDSGTKHKKAVILTHANGYASGCYSYILEELAKKFRVIGLDLSGHGGSEFSLRFENWFYFRDEILVLIERESLNGVIGIGHSLGGASMLLSAYKEPSKFSKIIAFDPVVLDYFRILYVKIFGNPLSESAKNRRKVFKNIDVVRKVFRKFPAFSDWDNRVFEDYLKYCFKKNKSGVELNCSPVVECKIFNCSDFRTLSHFANIQTETHLIYPKKYEVCPPWTAKKIAKGNPKSTVTKLENATHFFPFEMPEWTLNKVKELVHI